MVTAINRHRVASSERWQAALRRALEKNIEVFVVADTGERMATSASHLDQLHRVTADTCTCPAAVAGDPCCLHRAALRFVLGQLTLDEPEETPATIPCPDCVGKGWAYQEVDGGRAWPDQIPCRRCRSTGRVLVSIVRTPHAPSLAAD